MFLVCRVSHPLHLGDFAAFDANCGHYDGNHHEHSDHDDDDDAGFHLSFCMHHQIMGTYNTEKKGNK